MFAKRSTQDRSAKAQEQESPRDVRMRAGRSQEYVAVHTGTSVPTVRLFETPGGRDAIKDKRKVERLVSFYAGLASDAGQPAVA